MIINLLLCHQVAECISMHDKTLKTAEVHQSEAKPICTSIA